MVWKTIDEPNRALGLFVVYEQGVTFHKKTKTGFGVGVPPSEKSFKNIFKFLQGREDFSSVKFEGMVPENVLKYCTDTGSITFYTPPQRRMMLFNHDSIQNTEYNIPWLLWKYSDNSLDVYALKSKPKNEKDKIYQAPMFNISSNGRVCMGNVKFKNSTGKFNGFMDQLQELFFNSIFTHTNNNRLAKRNIHAVYEDAKNSEFNWNKDLVQTKMTLKDLL